MKTALTVPALAVLVLASLLTVACGNDDATTAPTTPALPSSEVFSGTVDVQGSSFYSFTTATSGEVSITLASLVATQPGPALNTVMSLGVGTPLGTECSVTNSVPAAPGLTAQLVNTLTPATYCTRISDVGNLKGPVNFTIRIVHP